MFNDSFEIKWKLYMTFKQPLFNWKGMLAEWIQLWKLKWQRFLVKKTVIYFHITEKGQNNHRYWKQDFFTDLCKFIEYTSFEKGN